MITNGSLDLSGAAVGCTCLDCEEKRARWDESIASAKPAAPERKLVDLGLKGDVYTNPQGGKQTKLLHRLDILPPAALVSVGRVMGPGAEKYGENNWHNTTVAENINHALGHIMAHCYGDRSEPHLGHAATRILFALQLEIEKQGKLDV